MSNVDERPFAARLTGEVEQRLSDEAEARRLRTMLAAVMREEGALLGLLDLRFSGDEFSVVFCSPEEEAEAGLAREAAAAIAGFDWLLAAYVVAAREFMPKARLTKWDARAREIVATWSGRGR